MSTEKQYGQGFHSLLVHIASGVDPVHGLERLFLLGVDRGRTVHLLHLAISVLVNLYSTTRRFFAFLGELPEEGLPSVVELPAEALAVRCYMRTIPRADHVSHLGGVSPPNW